MADSFSKLFCCLYIVATFLCSLVIAAESSTCVALPYGNELKDDSTVCKLLIDLPREDLVFAGEETCFCVVTTSACTDADISWDGSLYHAKSKITPEKNLTRYWYCGIVSEDQNGTFAQFHLTSDVLNNTNSTPVLLKVAGPPPTPTQISAYKNCASTQTAITWSSSATAHYYILSLQCKETNIQNKTTNNVFYYEINRNLQTPCDFSVIAVNPAGHSEARKAKVDLSKGPEGFHFSSVGVVFDVSQPFIYLNMSVFKSCSFLYPTHLNICVVGEHCVRVNNSLFGGTVNSGFGWWYMKVTELPIQLHKFLAVTIIVCNKAGCETFKKRISSYHTQKIGTCSPNGTCSLFCEQGKGYKIKGCIYKFIRKDGTTLPLVYVAYRSYRSYTLEPGDYNIFIYDWEVGSDVSPGPGPAVVMSVSVITQKNIQNHLGIGIVIGIILGVVGVVIVLSIKGIFYGRQSWWCFGYSRNVRHDAVRVIEEVPLLSISNKRPDLNDTSTGMRMSDESVPTMDDELVTETPLSILPEAISKNTDMLPSCGKMSAGVDGDQRTGRVEAQRERTSDSSLSNKKHHPGSAPSQYLGQRKLSGEGTHQVNAKEFTTGGASKTCSGFSIVLSQPISTPQDETKSCLLAGTTMKPLRTSKDTTSSYTNSLPWEACDETLEDPPTLAVYVVT